MVKPINSTRLERALSKIHKEEKKDIRIGIKTKGSMEFIKVSEILYIEKLIRICTIHLIGDRVVETCEAINKLEKILTVYHFYRPHQSYLIPITGVSKDNFMRSYNISLSDCSDLVKLSKKKYHEFRKLMFERSSVITRIK